ncbi:MAG: hypothetical protein V3R98_01985 [Alphaproteobacteria bacterium]
MVVKRCFLHSVLCAGVAAVAVATGAAPAGAQEIEELRRQIEALMQRVEQLEAQQRSGRAQPAGAADALVESGNDSIRLTLSGQVNRGVLFADNGADSEVFHVDNDNSSTRVRMIGEGDLDDDITVGTQIEVQFESNSSAAISFDQDSSAGPNNFTERKLELYVDSDRAGRLWLGQGDTASNSTSEVDLSGTAVVAHSAIGEMAGGLAFDLVRGGDSVRIKDAFSNFDGLSRDDRLRYDTPNLGGFTASASAIETGTWDAAVRFSGDIAGTRAVAAVAYADANGFDQVNGSASVLLPSGFNVTAAAGTRDLDAAGRDDPVFYYVKLGQRLDLFDIGGTALAVDFTQVEDLDADGDEFTSYGVFFVQNIDPVATELYLGVRNHELSVAGLADPDDVFAVLAGARIKF